MSGLKGVEGGMDCKLAECSVTQKNTGIKQGSSRRKFKRATEAWGWGGGLKTERWEEKPTTGYFLGAATERNRLTTSSPGTPTLRFSSSSVILVANA